MARYLSTLLFLVGFLVSFGVMAFTLFLETHSHLVPCSLCIFQRVAAMFAMLIFLIAFIHGLFRPKAVIVYVVLGSLVGLIGLGFSLRQIYLQSLPPSQVPGCGPGLNFLLRAYPLFDVLKIVFQGSGDCAKIDWRGLGLSLADWAGIYFVGLMILNMGILGCNRPKK